MRPTIKSSMRHCNPTSMHSGTGWTGTVHRPASAAELGDCGGRSGFQRDLIAAYRHAHPSCGPVVERVEVGCAAATESVAADHTRDGDRQAPLEGIYQPRDSRETDPSRSGTVDGPASPLRRHRGNTENAWHHMVLLLGGPATTAAGLRAAARISAATGAKALVETFPARLARGQGVPDIPRLGYFAEQAQEQLRGTTHLILVEARSPVTFFAYPDMQSDLVPAGARVALCGRPLEELADRLGAPELPRPASPANSERAAAIRQLGLGHRRAAARERDHLRRSQHERPVAARRDRRVAAARVLTLTGGAIGQGLPVAVGAAIAAPHRPVIALQADGVRCTRYRRCGRWPAND